MMGTTRQALVVCITALVAGSVAHSEALSMPPPGSERRAWRSVKALQGGGDGAGERLSVRGGTSALHVSGGSGVVDDADALNAQRAGRVVAVSAALGSLMQGYDTGVIGGALLFITPEFGLDAKPLMQGMIVTATTVGSIVGTLSASKLSDGVGRRGTMLLASAKFVAAYVQSTAHPASISVSLSALGQCFFLPRLSLCYGVWSILLILQHQQRRR